MFKTTDSTPLILYSGMDTAWDRVKKIQEDFKATGYVQNFQLIGVSGLGKSTMARTYAELFGVTHVNGVRRKRVVYFRVPPKPSEGGVFGALNVALGGPNIGTGAEQSRRAINYAKTSGCELILVDEGQHFLDRGQYKTHAHAGDYWKDFHDAYTGIIGFVGAPRLRRLFDVNNQWRNRAGEDIVVRPFAYESDFVGLAGFVESVAKHFELEGLVDFLCGEEVLRRIQFATDGIPSQVFGLLQLLRIDLGPNASVVSMACLDRAWSRRPGAGRLLPNRRPFDEAFDFQRLCGVGEPFFPSTLDGDNHDGY